jgi:Carboxypeptidase regulatory-like domain
MRLRALILMLGLVADAAAQVVGGSLSGFVKDNSGAGLPRASVSIKSSETGAERILTTDESGRYSAPSIPVGKYEVTASHEGFAPQTKNGITLAVGERTTIDLELAVGELKQVVTVEESASPVTLSTQATAGLVSERQVKELPLNGRSFDLLMTLSPGVVNYTTGRTGGVGTSSSALGNQFAVSGHRPQDNLYLLNGIEYSGASLINITPGGASGELLGVDAVREFNVVSDNYGAEYGKRAGGQVSIITASGTNQLHGTVYEFLRNNALDARNFFDQASAPQFQRNEFGGALGGPIKKDKLFLFGNYEGFRQHLAVSDVTLVPDNNARLGLVQNANGSFTNVGLAPGVAPLLSLWPVQNGPTLGAGIGVAFSNPLQVIHEDFGTTRFDYNVSNKSTISAVYTVDDSGDQTPSANPLSGVIELARNQVASIQEQHVFSPTLLNTARAGFSRGSIFFTGTVPGNLPGFVTGDPVGAVVIGGGTAVNAASSITAAGANAASNLRAARNLFTYDDHAVWTHGIHTIEGGFWFQDIQANDNFAQNQFGQLTFSNISTFLQGSVATFSVVPAPTELGWRSKEYAGFLQDSMKLRPNLEVTLGFRFESTNGWNETAGRAANYGFVGNVINSNPTVGSSAFSINRAKFLPEPRVGLAWDPFHNSKTVIHAGFGIYRSLLDDLDYRLDQTAPFNTTVAFKNIPLTSAVIAPGATPPSGSKISPSGSQTDPYTPTVVTWSFKVEQQIAPGTALTIGYVGSHGYHEMLSVDANEPVPTFVNGANFYAAGAPLANPTLANTTTWLSEGVSSYNALQVDVNHRFSHGLQFRGVYTWSKSLDDGTALNSSVGSNAPGFVMFPLFPKLDWGPSTSDVRHLAVINGSYELPFGRGQKYLGGWSVSAIETIQSGFPFTPSLGYNPTNNGDSRNPIRPSVNPAFSGPVILGSPTQYYNPAAFINPAAGTYGNLGRDTLNGPGLATLDFSLLKVTPLTEKIKLQFRAEFFNILNHTNFGIPNTVVFTAAGTTPSPTAGVITSTSTSSRQIQFGLKLSF